MPEYQRIPGVELVFTKYEINALRDYFDCANTDELRLAALRYQSLFFMFCHEDDGIETFPGDHMSLALALAGEFAFENFRDLQKEPGIRYRERPKQKPGRKKNSPFSEEFLQKFQEARQLVSTNEEAVERLISLGYLQPGAKAKSVLRYMQKAEKERQLAKQEEEARYRQMCEDASELDLDIFEPR